MMILQQQEEVKSCFTPLKPLRHLIITDSASTALQTFYVIVHV